mgnify:CR=1 FL=1
MYFISSSYILCAMEVEACIHLKCAESVVQREIVPMIIIVFSNKGGTDKILSVIVDNACANQKVEVEFYCTIVFLRGFPHLRRKPCRQWRG